MSHVPSSPSPVTAPYLGWLRRSSWDSAAQRPALQVPSPSPSVGWDLETAGSLEMAGLPRREREPVKCDGTDVGNCSTWLWRLRDRTSPSSLHFSESHLQSSGTTRAPSSSHGTPRAVGVDPERPDMCAGAARGGRRRQAGPEAWEPRRATSIGGNQGVLWGLDTRGCAPTF